MKIYFYTQDYENYGAHDWDGKGSCPQYWKAKGGEDFILSAESWSEEMIDCVYSLIECSDEYFRRLMIGHLEVCEEFKTDFEESQLNYEGEIQYPAKRMSYDEFISLSEKMKECV